MFDIRAMPDQVELDLLAVAKNAEPATIGHFRIRGFPTGDIRLLHGANKRICGTAVTLAIPAADSSLLHHAVGMLRPGDILVVDRLGDARHAALGGAVAVAIKRTGALGVIIDGPCADPDEIAESGLPVWSRGISSITTRLQGVGGAMNVPVSIGGAVVMPGNLVIADRGGIVILPTDEALVDIHRAIAMQAGEERLLPSIGKDLPLGTATGATDLVMAKLAST